MRLPWGRPNLRTDPEAAGWFMTRKKNNSRSAALLDAGLRHVGAPASALAALALLAACAADPGPQRAGLSGDPRALAAELDALQRQPGPASDEVIAALERTLHEQREKRARAVVAAGTTTVIPSSAPAPSPSLHPVERPLAAPAVVPTAAAAVTGPARTPMSRISESRMPVDELYARGRELELQAQVVAAIGLYREASQRGHAPSSQRLMELYADGAPGVARDYRVAVFFKERAVQQGASFESVWRH